MSFWSFWNGKDEAPAKDFIFVAQPEKIGLIAVLTAGKWEQYCFVGGSVYVEEGRLRFISPHRGYTCFAPGIWSAIQTLPLSEECQALIRDYYKTRVYDFIIEEKIKMGTL